MEWLFQLTPQICTNLWSDAFRAAPPPRPPPQKKRLIAFRAPTTLPSKKKERLPQKTNTWSQVKPA